MRIITFGKETIPYELIWSNKRKTVGVAVKKDRIYITAPEGTAVETIDHIVKEKMPWIRKQLQENEEVQGERIENQFLSGEKLPYLGREYRLKVHKGTNGTTPTFRFYQGKFYAAVPGSLPEEQYREMLYPLYKEWITKKGTKFIQERIPRFTLKLQEEPIAVQIREQKQRWGSCTPAGKILLNWHVFLAQTSVIDYVLVHELAHLKHLNHSYEFWSTVKMLLPNYEEKKEWLRINGKKLYV